MRKKILITGGQGMFGTACAKVFSRSHKVLSLGHADLDVTSPNAFSKYIDWKPDIMIHAAANVQADYCEDHPDECMKTQVQGTKNAIDYCRKTGAKMFYPQSFLIFDGTELPITETTEPKPLSVYGKAKLEAELLVRRELPDSLVVRMAGFFGGEEKDKNFVGKFSLHLKKCIAQGIKTIDVGDRIWQPTFTEDLAENSLLLIEQEKNGIYAMACKGKASFFELACEMVRILGISEKIKINKINAGIIREKCIRPAIAIMENVRLQKEGLDKMRPWQKSLEEYLSRPYFREMFQEN